MTGVLRELYLQGAFNPGLPHYELAASHVPFGELGFTPAPEKLVIDAVSQGDGLTLVVGESGAGKSSLMTYVAERLVEPNGDERAFLPLLVPVAAHGAGTSMLGWPCAAGPGSARRCAAKWCLSAASTPLPTTHMAVWTSSPTCFAD